MRAALSQYCSKSSVTVQCLLLIITIGLCMEIEIWKAIPGHAFYEASNLGRIRSLDRTIPYVAMGKSDSFKIIRGRILRGSLNPVNGYRYVHLGRRTAASVHSLVALAFFGDRDDNQVVRHKDGNKANNAVANLEYGTGSENYEDSIRHKTARYGENHPMSKLTLKEVQEIKRLNREEKLSGYKIQKMMNVSYQTVMNIINGKSWRMTGEDKEHKAA